MVKQKLEAKLFSVEVTIWKVLVSCIANMLKMKYF